MSTEARELQRAAELRASPACENRDVATRLEVGDEFGPSEWVELAPLMFERFLTATGAPEHPEAIIPYVLLSLLPGMSSRVVPRRDSRLTVNYGLNKVRFGTLPEVGSRVRASFRVDDLLEADWGAQLTMTATVHRETGSEPACIAELVSRAYR